MRRICNSSSSYGPLNFYNTPTKIRVDDENEFVDLIDKVDSLDAGDILRLAVTLQFSGLATSPARTFTIYPVLGNAALPSQDVTIEPPVACDSIECTVTFDAFIANIPDYKDLSIYVSSSVDEDLSSPTCYIYSYGDLPGGGVDVSTVMGKIPLTDDDVAHKILDNPDNKIHTYDDGRVQGSSGVFSQKG